MDNNKDTLGKELLTARMSTGWRIFLAIICLFTVARYHDFIYFNPTLMRAVLSVLWCGSALIFYWHQQIKLVVFENGVIIHGILRTRQYFWSNVEKVFFKKVQVRYVGAPIGFVYYVKLHFDNGDIVPLNNNLSHVEKLLDVALPLIRTALIEKWQRQLKAKENISFGRIVATNEGLYCGSQFVPWSRVRLRQDSDRICIMDLQSTFVTQSLSEMPNSIFLVDLAPTSTTPSNQ